MCFSFPFCKIFWEDAWDKIALQDGSLYFKKYPANAENIDISSWGSDRKYNTLSYVNWIIRDYSNSCKAFACGIYWENFKRWDVRKGGCQEILDDTSPITMRS